MCPKISLLIELKLKVPAVDAPIDLTWRAVDAPIDLTWRAVDAPIDLTWRAVDAYQKGHRV